MLQKIVSGGQTGADRAALDAGLELAFPVGGFCPKGRVAEDGNIADIYPLVEINGGYRHRTKVNVKASDGTAIFYEAMVRGGTEQTLLFCTKANKPYKLIDISLVSCEQALAALQTFIGEFHIEILNVAGPRASGCLAVYDYVKTVIAQVIQNNDY
jgi:hypothetical protein